MPSAMLFHGPGARDSALQHAHKLGKLMAPPFGEEKGLRVNEAREIVRLLRQTPLGDVTGVVLMGPMDLSTVDAAEALLKSIEQFDGVVHPVLWAHDLGNVMDTIRSRCLDQWCPGLDIEPDEELEERGRALVSSILNGDLWEVPWIVGEFKGREMGLAGVVAEALSGEDDPKALGIWDRLRKVLIYNNPRYIEVVSALFPSPEDI